MKLSMANDALDKESLNSRQVYFKNSKKNAFYL